MRIPFWTRAQEAKQKREAEEKARRERLTSNPYQDPPMRGYFSSRPMTDRGYDPTLDIANPISPLSPFNPAYTSDYSSRASDHCSPSSSSHSSSYSDSSSSSSSSDCGSSSSSSDSGSSSF